MTSWKPPTERPASNCSIENPDLIILDLGLPDIEGIELAKDDPWAERTRPDRGAFEPRR